jgi:hypothetical protein
MRLTDTALAFPFIVLAVGLAAIFGPSGVNAALAIGLSQMPQLVRVIRGDTLPPRSEIAPPASAPASSPRRWRNRAAPGWSGRTMWFRACAFRPRWLINLCGLYALQSLS